MSTARIEQAIFALLSRRKPGATIRPSEVARLLAAAEGEDAWRALMEPVRETARGLVRAGRLLVTQGGVPVDPASAKGAIRLRLP